MTVVTLHELEPAVCELPSFEISLCKAGTLTSTTRHSVTSKQKDQVTKQQKVQDDLLINTSRRRIRGGLRQQKTQK